MPAGNLADYEIIRHPGAAAIVAVDDEKRVCLLRQFRPAAGGWIWELPAGRRELGESPEQTASRSWWGRPGATLPSAVAGTILSSCPASKMSSSPCCWRRDLAAQPVHHEAFEAIEIHWVNFGEALRPALTGEIRDSKTVAALGCARMKSERTETTHE